MRTIKTTNPTPPNTPTTTTKHRRPTPKLASPLHLSKRDKQWFERFYGDGPPHWREGRTQKAPISKAEAHARRTTEVRQLRDLAGDKSTPIKKKQILNTLADTIEGCHSGSRCQSQACILCRRALQRYLVWTLPTCLAKADEPLAVISIIPSIRIPVGYDISRAREKLNTVLRTLAGR